MKFTTDTPTATGLYVLDYGDGEYVADFVDRVETDEDERHLIVRRTGLYLCEDHLVKRWLGPIDAGGENLKVRPK